MCGICGYVGDYKAGLIEKMAGLIAHRGPDDEGFWGDKDSRIFLGHRRLSIIDLSSNARQPMSNETGSIWITFNGEIYNYRELREEMIRKGHLFKSLSDTEVLLHLYEEYGIDMLNRLNGIFAFALWDGKSKELFLVRDAYGVKPFYYYQGRNDYVFASELKALMVYPGISLEIDSDAVFQYMTYLWASAPRTMLKKISKLPLATAQLVKEGKIVKEWYWHRPAFCGNRLYESQEAIAVGVATRLEEAVRRQLISDVPVGAYLSGGVDSSSVVSMMRRVMPATKIDAYTIGFKNQADMDGDPIDLPYARQVADYLNVNLREIIVSSDDLINKIEEMLFYLDEPQADPAPINAMIIAERARFDGVKVLLSGTGGDDIFGGYRRHAAICYEKVWCWLPYLARKALLKTSSLFGHEQNLLRRRFAKAFAFADATPQNRLVSYFKWTGDKLRNSLLSDEMRKSVASGAAEMPLYNSLTEIPFEDNFLNRMLYLELKHFLADHNLNYTDKMSMRHGIEVRVPFLDEDLVMYASKIPPRLKNTGFNGKVIFKKSMEPFLPKSIIYRKKTGFGAPLRRWIKTELDEYVKDVLCKESVRSRGLFDYKNIENLIKQNTANKVDGSYTIFSMLCIELWCRLFIDKKGLGKQLVF